MTESTTSSSSAQPASFRVSLRTLLLVITFVALICALVVQTLELRNTRASLSRYETTLIPTALGSNEFRVIVQAVLQTDHAIVIEYRIESLEDHFATVASGGDSSGARARFDGQTNLYVTDSVLFVDHVVSKNVLKVMPTVSGAQGYSVYSVEDDFSLPDSISILEPDSVHARDETVELFKIDGRSYTLQLKP